MTQLRDFDWSEIVFDLKRAGMSHGGICAALGNAVSESGIRSYMAGGQLAHWRGELLLELWMAKTGKCREEAPTRAAPYRHVGARRAVQKRPTLQPGIGDLDALGRFYGVDGKKLLEAIQRAAQPMRRARPRAVGDTRTLTLPGIEVVEVEGE